MKKLIKRSLKLCIKVNLSSAFYPTNLCNCWLHDGRYYVNEQLILLSQFYLFTWYVGTLTMDSNTCINASN